MSRIADKQHILDEIRRTAETNGGVPLGLDRFFAETGLRRDDWYGRYWRNWGEACVEAGYTPNRFRTAFDDDHVLQKLVDLILEIDRFPVAADLRLKARETADFPSHNVFECIGSKVERARKAIDYCRNHGVHERVIEICEPIANSQPEDVQSPKNHAEHLGFVYLMKSGRFYKIGRTNSVGRREYELAIQLPEKASLVHQIKTDDPSGIEAYWHNRFREKRQNGEFFKLTADDVAAFRRRRFM